MVMLVRFLFVSILSVCVSTNGFSKPLKPESDMNVNVYLGQPLKKTFENSDVSFSEDCIPGVYCQYDYNIPASTRNQPSLTLHDGVSKATFEKVNGIVFQVGSAVADNDRLESFYFHLTGLPDDSLDELNKKFAYDILSKLLGLGWRRYIYESEPRVPGEQTEKLSEPDKISGGHMMSGPLMDPSYTMSDAQWNRLGSNVTWRLYRRNAFLQLNMMRQESDVEGRGTYLFSINVETEESWYRGFVENNKDDWKIRLPEVLKLLKEKRVAVEKKLEEDGVVIDKSYEDPQLDF